MYILFVFFSLSHILSEQFNEGWLIWTSVKRIWNISVTPESSHGLLPLQSTPMLSPRQPRFYLFTELHILKMTSYSVHSFVLSFFGSTCFWDAFMLYVLAVHIYCWLTFHVMNVTISLFIQLLIDIWVLGCYEYRFLDGHVQFFAWTCFHISWIIT